MPRAVFKDPFRGGNNILVLTDTYTPAGEPLPTMPGGGIDLEDGLTRIHSETVATHIEDEREQHLIIERLFSFAHVELCREVTSGRVTSLSPPSFPSSAPRVSTHPYTPLPPQVLYRRCPAPAPSCPGILASQPLSGRARSWSGRAGPRIARRAC